MAQKVIDNAIAMQFALALVLVILLLAPNLGFVASKKAKQVLTGVKLNAIDQCWRRDQNWRRNRPKLAACSVGFAGKMSGNAGRGLIHYMVTDPSDNPVNPKPGTLRYGATMIKGKVWITFQRDMRITLQKTLLISSFTAIDGRGFSVHIVGNACLMVYKESNIIIHGLRIHQCRAQAPSSVMSPSGKVMPLGQVDGDAIRLVSATKIWIDHNTLYQCQDGLLDVTRSSTDITISNNWFRDQDKVMLLGHDDGYIRDKNMKVTSRMDTVGNKQTWKFYSVRDVFENGASFIQTGFGGAKPNYNAQQRFPVVDAKFVRQITIMILPVVKLGTLALKTFCKPIANRLKKEAGLHPKFRQFIINIAQGRIGFTRKLEVVPPIGPGQGPQSGTIECISKEEKNNRRGLQCACSIIEAYLPWRCSIFTLHCVLANHRFQTQMQRRIYGHDIDVAIRPLNEEKAVQAAADLLGELFVFTVAGAAVIFEVQRSSRSEARKEEVRRQELQAMKQRDEDLAREIELLKQKIEEIEQVAKGRGLSGILHFRHAHTSGDGKHS
ncbi:hypothetical protein TIFTF001_023036 [Ficus carica]|uniref:Pectate lyase n=1 Tax=Ficus carica TaxID=3494 RepID=A0AA88DK39_FICCA|nr:hypothetical protein TIFTF001_023036 [Ficus carica]